MRATTGCAGLLFAIVLGVSSTLADNVLTISNTSNERSVYVWFKAKDASSWDASTFVGTNGRKGKALRNADYFVVIQDEAKNESPLGYRNFSDLLSRGASVTLTIDMLYMRETKFRTVDKLVHSYETRTRIESVIVRVPETTRENVLEYDPRRRRWNSVVRERTVHRAVTQHREVPYTVAVTKVVKEEVPYEAYQFKPKVMVEIDGKPYALDDVLPPKPS